MEEYLQKEGAVKILDASPLTIQFLYRKGGYNWIGNILDGKNW